MFRKNKHTIDDLYDLFMIFTNSQNTKIRELEKYNGMLQKTNGELVQAIEGKNKLLEEKESKYADIASTFNGLVLENQKLNRKVEEKEKKVNELSNYIKGATEKLIEAQLKYNNRTKPIRGDYIADGMNKIDETTKARLK